MLQWMGGSRRNIATSRRSTHKRQKQYFQQKKRQQQTAGLDNDVDGVSTHIEFHEKPKSLDILSLLNLAKVAQECKSDRANERESFEINPLPENYQVSNCPLTSSEACKDPPIQKESGSSSPAFAVENVSPKKFSCRNPVDIPSSHNHCSNKTDDKLCHQGAETECKLSVFDLLGDDGCNGNSDGSPINESHVAFSVEGLGKMRMGTPAHSPLRPGRVFANGSALPRKPAKRYHSSRNCNYSMNGVELELNTLIHDINMPLGGSFVEIPINSRGTADCINYSKSKKLSGEECKPPHSQGCQIDDFFGNREYLYSNINKEKPWKSRSVFLHDDFPVECDVSWEDPTCNKGGSSFEFLGNGTHNETDYAFEDFYLRKERDLAQVPREVNVLDSPDPFLKHLASEKDHDFIPLDATRYPTVDRRWDFEPPTWSHFAAENAKDNMSFLSEESCSSSAVMGEKYSESNSIKPRESLRYGCEHFTKDATKTHYAEETWYKDIDKIHRGKNLTGSREYNRVLNPTWSRSLCHPNELSWIQKDSESRWLLEEGQTFMDVDSGLCSSQRTAESDLASFECKSWSKNLFDQCQTSTGMFPSSKKSRLDASVKCSPHNNFCPETDACPQSFNFMHLNDPIILTNIELKSRKSDTSRASRIEEEASYSSHANDFSVCSGKENCTMDGKDKSECQPPDCESFPNDREKEVLAENNDILTDSGKTVEGPGSKDNCGECTEIKDDFYKELVEKPINRESSGIEEEASSSTKELPDKLESCTNDEKYQTDSPKDLPSESGNKGRKESPAEERIIGNDGNHNNEPSYQVMLESYVLQLLCVQKVLKEASEHNTSRKVPCFLKCLSDLQCPNTPKLASHSQQ